jgi:hypothetical protein
MCCRLRSQITGLYISLPICDFLDHLANVSSCRCSFQVSKAPKKMALWCLLLIGPASSESSRVHVLYSMCSAFFQKDLGPLEFPILRHDDLIHPFRRYNFPYFCWHPSCHWRPCSCSSILAVTGVHAIAAILLIASVPAVVGMLLLLTSMHLLLSCSF